MAASERIEAPFQVTTNLHMCHCKLHKHSLCTQPFCTLVCSISRTHAPAHHLPPGRLGACLKPAGAQLLLSNRHAGLSGNFSHHRPTGNLSLSNLSPLCLFPPQANHCHVGEPMPARRPVAPISLPRHLTNPRPCLPCLSTSLHAAYSVCATWCLLGTLWDQPLLDRHSGSNVSPACAVPSGSPLSVHQPVSAGRPVPRRVATTPGTAGGPAPPANPPPVPHRAVQRPGASAGQLQVCGGHGGAEREPCHAGRAGPPVCEGCRWACLPSNVPCVGPMACLAMLGLQLYPGLPCRAVGAMCSSVWVPDCIP